MAALTPVKPAGHGGLFTYRAARRDALALRADQLKPRFWVTEAKTGKARMVGLPDDLRRTLELQAGKVWVFPKRGRPEEHRTRQAVWKDVKRAAKAFRLPQNVGPHSARKVYAVELLKKYGDIDKVRRALNHGSVSTTMIYARGQSVGREAAAEAGARA